MQSSLEVLSTSHLEIAFGDRHFFEPTRFTAKKCLSPASSPVTDLFTNPLNKCELNTIIELIDLDLMAQSLTMSIIYRERREL
jgi:hypothetical protein